jgi:hypothetical protein
MMDHLSLKSWAAAELIEVPDQAKIAAIASTWMDLTNNENMITPTH